MNQNFSGFADLWQTFKSMLPSLIRFIIVGVGATLIHFITGWFLEYQHQIDLFFANLIGFLVAFIFSFLGHYYFTFRKSNRIQQALIRFFTIACLGFIVNNVVLLICQVSGMNNFWSLLFAVGVMPLASYLFSYFWAFNAHAQNKES